MNDCWLQFCGLCISVCHLQALTPTNTNIRLVRAVWHSIRIGHTWKLYHRPLSKSKQPNSRRRCKWTRIWRIRCVRHAAYSMAHITAVSCRVSGKFCQKSHLLLAIYTVEWFDRVSFTWCETLNDWEARGRHRSERLWCLCEYRLHRNILLFTQFAHSTRFYNWFSLSLYIYISNRMQILLSQLLAMATFVGAGIPQS